MILPSIPENNSSIALWSSRPSARNRPGFPCERNPHQKIPALPSIHPSVWLSYCFLDLDGPAPADFFADILDNFVSEFLRCCLGWEGHLIRHFYLVRVAYDGDDIGCLAFRKLDIILNEGLFAENRAIKLMRRRVWSEIGWHSLRVH